MKLLILSLVLSVWSQCHVLTLQTPTATNVGSNPSESLNPVLSSRNVHEGAFEICRKSFPDDKLDPSSHYIHDGCTVACLVGIVEYHNLPNQIGKPCPFNPHGTCDTYGRCHNEGSVQLGQLGIKLWQGGFWNITLEEQYYFVVVHIRNSSEPWPLESMDFVDSAAHCSSDTMPGPIASWAVTCDLSSFLFKETARIFLYAFAHKKEDPFNNVLVGSTSATIFEIVHSQKYGDAWVVFKLEPTPAELVLEVTFTLKKIT